MMTLTPKKLSGTIEILSSKSHAHRKLICAGLSKNRSQMQIKNNSNDVQATIDMLNHLGANIKYIKKDLLQIIPIYENKKNIIKTAPLLDAKESGSSIRFILPVATSIFDNISFTAKNSLLSRPLDDIIDVMEENGVIFSSKTLPFTTKNKLMYDNISIKSDISSQYLSGLLMAAPLQKKDVIIKKIGQIASRPYIDMTIATMKEYGVEVLEDEEKFFIKKQQYMAKDISRVEGDYSNAAFFVVAGAMGDKNDSIIIKKLDKDSIQGDKKILEIVKNIGAKVEVNKDMIKISGGNLKPFDIDVKDIPDLLPVLSILACNIKGKSKMYNAKRLIYKESNRLKTTLKMIQNLGGNAILTNDGIVIEGTGELRGGAVDSHNDHRIAMSAAIASTICKEDVGIINEKAVEKSYPNFFEDFNSLGIKS